MEQKIPSGGAARVASATLVAEAAVLPAPRRGSSWSRVNGTGSPSDRGLEEQHGSPARLLWPEQQFCRHLGAAALGAESTGLVPLQTEVWSSGKAESPIQTQEGSQTGDSWAEKHHQS
ncbi:hypothetical protein P7K49_016685 [Saguinus oedipus]|uniref:Uncharacterized protein n=1 Tax=Saguinus oedipus TaxID=9490 RepID=A0ABQ9VCQ6_SAGOE|nr:hypothetical protein P7K49_016685 [Saguinus oedipus]